MRLGAACAVFCILAMVACGNAEEDGGASTPAMWKVPSEPSLAAGAIGGASEVAFHQIAAAVRLSDGSLLVADGGLTSRIMVLTPDGQHRATIGRYGEGPGEFMWVTSLDLGIHDSVYVFDASQQRLTVLGADLEVTRTANYLPGGGGPLRDLSRLIDTLWLGQTREQPVSGPMGEIARDTVVLGVLSATLDRLRPIAELPSTMYTTTEFGGRRVFGSAPFTPTALHASWGRCIFTSTGDVPYIKVYTIDGTFLKAIEGPGVPRPVSQEDIEGWQEYRLERAAAADRSMVLEGLEKQGHPSHLPYYGQMVVDPWGYIWLEQYEIPGGAGAVWDVVSQKGDHIAEVYLPRDVRVFQIGEEGVLGIGWGEADEEVLLQYRVPERSFDTAAALPECRMEE